MATGKRVIIKALEDELHEVKERRRKLKYFLKSAQAQKLDHARLGLMQSRLDAQFKVIYSLEQQLELEKNV